MPRINLAKDFKGFNYITSETFNLPAGAAALFDDSGKIALSLMPSIASLGLDLSDYTSDNGVKLTNTKAGGAVELVAATGKNFKLNADGSVILNGNAQNAANGLVVLDSNAKIAASMLPDLAITQVYTADASSAVVGTDTVLGLIKTALGANAPQRGDVVIITATGKEQADAFGGTYIFVSDVASVADITADNYVKTYVPAGSITSVNGQLPNASGAVTVGWTNIGDGSVTSFAVANSIVSVNGIELASKSVVDGLNTEVTNARGTYANVNARLEAMATATGTAQTAAKNAMTEAQKKVNAEAGKELASTTDIAKWNATSTEVDNFGDIVTHNASEFETAGAAAAVLGSDADTAGAATVYGANKAASAASAAAGVADGKAVAAQNTADGIKTAVSGKAVELVEKTVNLTAGTVDGVTVAIADGVVTMTVPGRVICVYDAQGKQVYPDVTYAKATSTTTLVADYGATALDASWDVTYTKAIVIA